MTHFVRHEACPECGSKDNLGVWSDDSKWCFGCRHYVPPTGSGKVKQYFNKGKGEPFTKVVKLPEDALPYLPNHAKEWLKNMT